MYEVCLNRSGNLIQKMSVFQQFEPQALIELTRDLRNEIYLPGDIIMREGENAVSTYFINDGTVDIKRSDGSVMSVEKKGGYVGEAAVVGRGFFKTSSMVSARTHCNTSVLDAVVLNRIVDLCPH